MKAHIVLPPPTLENSLHAIPASLINRAWESCVQFFHKFAETLRPSGFDEAYLAQAQNHADLERRMLEITGNRVDSGSRFYY